MRNGSKQKCPIFGTPEINSGPDLLWVPKILISTRDGCNYVDIGWGLSFIKNFFGLMRPDFIRYLIVK